MTRDIQRCVICGKRFKPYRFRRSGFYVKKYCEKCLTMKLELSKIVNKLELTRRQRESLYNSLIGLLRQNKFEIKQL